MSTATELSLVPALRGSWVAVDPTPHDVEAPICTLRSGAVVVDADEDLDQLCRRIKAARLTALTILYAA